MKTWKHPKLGNLKYDDDQVCWIGKCHLPAFKVFKWKSKKWKSKLKKPVGEFELLFATDDGATPSTRAAMLATLVVANHEKLASLVAPTLWEDFNGRGPESGMWWHGDMGQVEENIRYGDCPKPKGPQDLLSVMRFTRLVIHESVYKYKAPIGEFTFAALFDEEHGVGILTDGEKIVGTGYAQEASPFELK